MTDKVLLVDDDPNVLQGFKRHLRKRYDITLAVGGHAALEAIAHEGPFAVVVSDMQMPEMSGVEFLSKVLEINPHTIRVMLTGNADQKTAVDAVNDGKIFRFLNKPCEPDALAQALDAGIQQYRLVTAEAELLNKTLAGSVRMLTEVLSLTMPDAFGLTQEARNLTREVAIRIGVGPLWQIEIAAMLMRVGCVSMPQETLTQYLSGRPLAASDQAFVDEMPKRGQSLIAAIPRLQGVADLILAQNGAPADPTPIAARILRAVGDYQRFRSIDSPRVALQKLNNAEIYDPSVVEILASVISENQVDVEVAIDDLRDGMILSANVLDRSGRLLLASGIEVHQAMIHKLQMLQRSGMGVEEPIRVLITRDSAPAPITTPETIELSPNFFQED
ncbi:response regulator [Stieleria varia]|uniref:Hydrogenase transcriptional regulatory protein hupR1 n=1 Tax=Stieleria varia TaxID=2528005 RepID=A0A5C5ZRQ2_9BACT|nr:response regulator [Stieleria varia]TWT89471.1 Hydrogenase transcriptional regulatory protein hupR1 [Stieleria varia]